MSRDKFLPNIDTYFANTTLEHMQNVYNDIKDFEQYGPDVDEYLCGIGKPTSSIKVESAASDVMLDSMSDIHLQPVPKIQICVIDFKSFCVSGYRYLMCVGHL